MRNIWKDVELEIDEQKYLFKIKKMDALSTSGLIKMLTEKLLPGIKELQDIIKNNAVPDDAKEEDLEKINQERTQMIFDVIPKILELLTEKELIDLEKKCLRTVYVSLPAGLQPAMIGDGFGLDVLEYETSAVLILCYEVIAFNVKDFFGGNSLSSILSRLNMPSQEA